MTLEMTAPLIAEHATPDLPAEGGPWPAPGEWTYEDYLRLPDDGRRYEIIAGVLYVTASPRFNHQYVVGELFAALRAHARQRNLGIVIPAPFEVHLPDIAWPVQPDLIFLRAGQQPAPEADAFVGTPDLVVEVLSPSTARRDRVVKFWAYERAGVPEYWIVDPGVPMIEVYVLQAGVYTRHGQFMGGDSLTSPALPELTLPVANLFA